MSLAPRREDAARSVPLPSPPPLSVTALTANYGGRDVLRAVDLTVSAGRVRVLLGPNGAGKTTLVRAICGRIAPSSGHVEICGLSAQSADGRQLIGLAPQEVALYRPLTVRENLEIFGRIAGITGSALTARVCDILERAHIAERADERIDRLSGGWQKRVNLAAALLGAPRLLVLDEPSAGIDREAWTPLSELIRELAQEGLGILLITHDFLQAEVVGDDVTILEDGEVLLDGPIKALLAERFGGQREVEVSLADAPPPERLARLAALGLSPTSDPNPAVHLFTGLVPGSTEALSAFIAGLEREGIAPSALAIREPGLAQLYGAALHGGRS